MENTFYSNGKLLLTGEYAVLDGALSLAVPTKYGQYLKVSKNHFNEISWQSLDEKNEIWFEARLNSTNLEITSASDMEIAKTLQKILLVAKNSNSSFLLETNGVLIETKLTFPKDWGLGTSSTLINNIAQWAKIDAYKLLRNTIGGSGYDIACAQHNTPIQYQLKKRLPEVKEISFNPEFKEHLYFVYLNKKKNSREGINQYRKQEFNSDKFIKQISNISKELIGCTDLLSFEKLLTEHENVVSNILKISPVKATLFSDYWGAIKSLGAWGGDFILVTGNEKTPEYFISKGFNVVISYEEMVFS